MICDKVLNLQANTESYFLKNEKKNFWSEFSVASQEIQGLVSSFSFNFDLFWRRQTPLRFLALLGQTSTTNVILRTEKLALSICHPRHRRRPAKRYLSIFWSIHIQCFRLSSSRSIEFNHRCRLSWSKSNFISYRRHETNAGGWINQRAKINQQGRVRKLICKFRST